MLTFYLLKLSRFFYALTLGLATSLFDFGADFNFAWSVPEDCGNTTATGLQTFHKAFVSSPCGLLYYKNVERLTYTYIAFPGFLLGFSTIRSLVRELICRCWRGEAHGIIRGLMSAFVVTLEVSLVVGLLFAAQWSDVWEKAVPDVASVYDYTIQGMAYLSSALIVGVKCLGVFCHGPETRRLVFRATKDKTIFEAATQLGLLVRIFMSSGVGSSASRLSAVSSIVVIGKVGSKISSTDIPRNCPKPPSSARSAWPPQFFPFSFSPPSSRLEPAPVTMCGTKRPKWWRSS